MLTTGLAVRVNSGYTLHYFDDNTTYANSASQYQKFTNSSWKNLEHYNQFVHEDEQ